MSEMIWPLIGTRLTLEPWSVKEGHHCSYYHDWLYGPGVKLEPWSIGIVQGAEIGYTI